MNSFIAPWLFTNSYPILIFKDTTYDDGFINDARLKVFYGSG
jgi:hypothetical protein